jgi:uncharacterized spore protein YtfJ
MNQAQEMLQSLSDRLAGSASVKQVYGEPIVVGAKTVVPVARVKYGLGSGWGGGEQEGYDAGRPLSGGGGGGGGGVKAVPVGALEITETSVRFIHFFDPAEIAKLCLAGGALMLLASLLRRRS